MCGRYVIDEEMNAYLKQLFHGDFDMLSGEMTPGMYCTVITDRLQQMHWGIPNGKLLINARAETVTEKPMYRRALNNRCVIPASAFFEWDHQRTKVKFTLPHERMYFAGIYQDDHFVILTTAANDSMREFHDRMPVILQEDKISNWIEHQRYEVVMPKLLNDRKYEQLTLL